MIVKCLCCEREVDPSLSSWARKYCSEYCRGKHRSIKYRESNKISRDKYAKSPEGRYKVYSYKAKERGLEFCLTFDEFKSFWQKPCSYCGGEIETIGLDRIDNNKGYLLSNVISCCKSCNWMKSSMSRQEFIDKCKAIISKNS